MPLEADYRPGTYWYTDFFEQIYIAPTQDGTSLLVFPKSFQTEDPATGKAFYDDDWLRDDDEDPRECVEDTVRVYEHLRASDPTTFEHPRLVRYLGQTSSGYRLERLSPGPMPDTRKLRASENSTVFAHYHRWSEDSLRPRAFTVRTFHAVDGPVFPEDSRNAGLVKGDLFDWAAWVYALMTGGEDFVRGVDGQWPQLSEDMLGPVLVRAAIGEYETAREMLQDVQRTVQESGVTILGEYGDELVGCDWQTVFAVRDNELVLSREI